MLKVLFFALFLISACGGNTEEQNVINPPPPKEDGCRTYLRPSKDSVSISVWLGKSQHLSESRVILALNAFWGEVGLKIVRASSPEQADFGLLYMSAGCRAPIEIGRLQHNEWADLDSILVDYTCFDKIPDYLEKLPSALSNALGKLMGIEGYPSFCSEGIMAHPILAMKVENPPTKLSEGDKVEFYKRTRFLKKTVYETVCNSEVVWENGSYTPYKYEEYTFWGSQSLVKMPIRKYLNKYFALFGRSFIQVTKPDLADFTVNDWGEEYNGCSPTAIAYIEEKEVFLKYGECVGAGNPLKDATVVVHEVAHLFGMQHIPEWCGNSIMSAQVNPGTAFTPADVLGWINRDPNPLETKILQVEKDKLNLTFVPLSYICHR